MFKDVHYIKIYVFIKFLKVRLILNLNAVNRIKNVTKSINI